MPAKLNSIEVSFLGVGTVYLAVAALLAVLHVGGAWSIVRWIGFGIFGFSGLFLNQRILVHR